ncbi:MAG: TetR/AcrR family transcriptional regulator [Candidatus Azobacteroides sp.]|nr:TetR/AcrR family transcriptional regulator [Candidatus Azobacteroides sp.]
MNLRDKIVEKASLLFFHNGVKSMTMSDIANELGISKRTLYEVFRDKEELLEACISARMSKADEEMRALANNSEDVIDTMMHVYAQQMNEMRNLNRSVLHDLKKYYSHIFKKMECKQKEDIHYLLPLLNKGVQQGLIRPDVNFDIILWLVRSQFKAMMDDDYLPMDKYSTREFVQAIILSFIRGIATSAGNEKVDMIMENLKKKEDGREEE